MLDNNCNNFTDTLCKYLVGKGIPSYITGLPAEFLNSPFGAALRPSIENIFGPSRFASRSTSNEVLVGTNRPSAVTRPIFQSKIPTPALDALPQTPIHFNSCSQIEVIFKKAAEFFADSEMNVSETVLKRIKDELDKKYTKKSITHADLPLGWNFIFGGFHHNKQNRRFQNLCGQLSFPFWISFDY